MTNQELAALVKKYPISLGCGVLALACAVGLYFRSDATPAALAEFEQVSAESERLSGNIRNAAQLDEQLALLAQADREIEPRIIRPGELAKNLQFFYKLEAETGAKLIELRQLPVVPARGPKTAYANVPFSVSVQGDYVAMLGFIRGLEYGGVYSRVLTARLARDGGGIDRTSVLRLDLSLELLGQP